MAQEIVQKRATCVEAKPNGTAVYLLRAPSSGALIFAVAKANGEMITALPVTERLLGLVQLLRG